MRIRIDKNLCVGCCSCEMACTLAHEQRFNPRHSRLRVPLTFPMPSTPVVCNHCKNARCVAACPTGALEQGEDRVIFHAEACVACGACTEACPFHAIWLNDGQIFKCDLCGGDPSCAKICPFNAISVMK
ncbi:MAG: 4Fe-4S dicluster domain-containing protein [Oscillibacter sp.]|nr:4Fe-4S dicluster domain-containing protein [Oscillibacter sp.]